MNCVELICNDDHSTCMCTIVQQPLITRLGGIWKKMAETTGLMIRAAPTLGFSRFLRISEFVTIFNMSLQEDQRCKGCRVTLTKIVVL